MYQFSSGSAYGLVGSSPAVPRKFGALQDINVDIAFTTKTLYGQNQYPIAIGRGQGKITGKAKFAQLHGAVLNELFFGNVSAVPLQSVMPIFGEVAAVPASTPWQVTVANAANFQDDLGVVYATTGARFTRVSGSPTQGQYSVSLGVYTFATADANAGVLIDYTFKVTTAGLQMNLIQQLSGSTPSFGLVLATKFQAPGDTMKPLYLKLNVVTSSKLSMATKMDDFMVPEFDLEAIADVVGNVGTFCLGE